MSSTKVHAWIMIVMSGRPALSRQTSTTPKAAVSIESSSNGYVALRQALSNANRDLTSNIQHQEALARRHAGLLKETLALVDASKKLVAGKQRVMKLSAVLQQQKA